MPQEYNDQLDDFFVWAYEELTAQELHEDYGNDLLRKFLVERTVLDKLSRCLDDAHGHSMTNLPTVLQEAMKRNAAIEQIGCGVRCFADDLPAFQTYLGTSRGKTLIGLKTGMPKLDERTLGLRDLIAIGAMPGIGKTTLVCQWGLNVLRHNADAVFVLVSLEMARMSLYTRLLCNQAEMDWKTVMLGSPSRRGSQEVSCFTPHDQERLTTAQTTLQTSGLAARTLILDQKTLGPDFTAARILRLIDQFKFATHCPRALIGIDYLQLLPAAGLADLDSDRHRVQFLKDLVVGTQTQANPTGDCVIAVSEMRKPAAKGKWQGKLADLMGSARLPYALDAAFVLRRLESENCPEIDEFNWSLVGVNMPSAQAFEQVAVAPIMLELVKGRDGFQQGSIALAFEYEKSRFLEIPRIATGSPSQVHSNHLQSPTGSPNGLPALMVPAATDVA
jgi:replicative DNA helicase